MSELSEQLSSLGYWPARAERLLAEGKHARVVELCRQHLVGEPYSLAGRLQLARALQGAGQTESALEEYYRVLGADPENVVALKNMADIRFGAGDELSALADYQRVLQIDPFCHGLKSNLAAPRAETIRTITLTRGAESSAAETTAAVRRIPFYTETLADLYLEQGHPRMAATVYRRLMENNRHPRLLEKLAAAERYSKDKERRNLDHVHETD